MRSLLFVPGDRAELHAKARKSRADAVILDLEDAVAASSVDEARAAVSQTLRQGTSRAGQHSLVRVGPEGLVHDLDALAGCPVDAIMLAKADLEGLDHARRAIRRHWALDERPQIICLVESSTGMLQVEVMASHSDVAQMMIGEIDLTADLGIEPEAPAGAALIAPLRLRVLLASRAAGLRPPIGPVWPDIEDVAGLERDTVDLHNQGFRSRAVIHPSHVDVVNAAFTPTPREIERARAVVDRYQRATRAGRGVVRDADGRMLDEAVVRSAREVLAHAHGSPEPPKRPA